MDGNLKGRITAAAKFLRAGITLRLHNMFGDVGPIVVARAVKRPMKLQERGNPRLIDLWKLLIEPDLYRCWAAVHPASYSGADVDVQRGAADSYGLQKQYHRFQQDLGRIAAGA
jgi:hypothetical protein